MPRSESSHPVTVNLKREVQTCWDTTRRGYPNTQFAMAALAAFRLLDEPQRDQLMMLVRAVQEQKAEWSAVVDWCEREQARVFELMQEAVEARTHREIEKQKPKRARRV